MKRIFAVLMCIVLLGSCCICAAAEDFTFRNGIHWRDSMEAVASAEGRKADGEGELDSGFTFLIYMAESVSNYEADLQYAFYNDELLLATYICYDLPESDQEYLVNALTSKYGEPIASDKERCVRLMDILEEGSSDYMKMVSNWELADGTYVAICTSIDGEVFDIIYFCEEGMLEAGASDFNTNGL